MKSYSTIILIVVAVGVFFTFTDPIYKEVQALQEQKKQNDTLMLKAEDLRKKRQELTTKYNSISAEERQQLLKVLPETVDNVRLILDMDNIARDQGIVLRGITISGGIDDTGKNSKVIDKTNKNYGVINVGFSFTAPYSVAKTFMTDLENSLRLVDIKKFSVAASDVGDVYNYTVSLDTYWLR